jgi:hypothetical protein
MHVGLVGKEGMCGKRKCQKGERKKKRYLLD